MKKIAISIICLLFGSQSSFAQSSASWQWGLADIADISAGKEAPLQHIAAVSGSKALWGMLQNRALDFSSFYFGGYKLTEYDSTGMPGTSAAITGKLFLACAKSDEAGNWYILGQYYDTANFPGGATFINPAPASAEPYFLVRLNAGTLACAWAKKLSNGTTFAITSDGLYLPIDTASATIIAKFDLSTGDRTDLFSQPFTSSTSSIALDGAGAIYLAGSCAFGGINFNGHVVTTSGVPYPVYMVKYKAGGVYDWHYLISDITCPGRQLTVAADNSIYYSGKITDSFTFGGFFVHQPGWVNDYLVTRLDSSGNILWIKQLQDTTGGDATVMDNFHAVPMADSTICVFTQIRGYINWGDGIITNCGPAENTGVVNYRSSGTVNWVKQIVGNTVDPRNIAGNGSDIWVTGNVYDSAAYHLDATAVPVVPITMTPYLAKLHTTRSAANTQIVAQDKPEIHVIPVPATNLVEVIMPSSITGNVRITLCDVSGRQVFEQSIIACPSASLDISKYSRGLYFISVSGENFRTVQKIILQ